MLRITCASILLILLNGCASAATLQRRLRVNIGSVGFYKNIIPGSFPNTGPPIDMALDEVRTLYADTLQINHTFISNWSLLSCDPELVDTADDLMANFYYRTREQADLTVFINPGCNEIGASSKLAAQWNVLQMSTASDNGFIADRKLNPVWISLATGSFTNIISAYKQLLQDYKWTNVFMVWENTSNPIFRGLSDVMSKALRAQPKMQPVYRSMAMNGQNDTNQQLRSLLEEFRQTSRVMLFFGHSDYLRKTLLSAYSMNMTSDEYVYIGVQPLYHFGSIGNFSWRFNDANDAIAKEAYRNVLLLGAEHLDNQTEVDLVDPVMREWRRQSLLKWNFTYNEPSPYLRTGYAAITMLAQVLNNTYTTNPDFDYRNGTALANFFLGKGFETKVMRVAIGEQGNILVNLSLRYPDAATHELRVVKQWDGVRQQYVHVANITWGNGPPSNRPVCGYMGDDPACSNAGAQNAIIGGTIGALVIVSAVAVILTIYIIKSKETKMALNDRAWVLEENDLFMTDSTATFMSLPHGVSAYYSMMVSLKNKYKRRWNGLEVWIQVLHGTALERGAAYKVLYEFNLPFQMLIREIKECSHPNMNRFLGLYQSNTMKELFFIYTVTAWSARGSIADLIESQQELDWLFRASFIQNLLSAINFVHSSGIKSHGSLSAHKCLLDQHFTLKLSGFGCDAIRKQIEQITKTTINEHTPKPQVTALDASMPEHAQVEDMLRVGKVIMEILHWQHAEDHLEKIDPMGSLSKHISGFPPPISGIENFPMGAAVRALAQSCQDNDVSRRPTAKAATRKLDDILSRTADFSGAVVDRILRRLEAYSVRLENEVLIKTNQLIHERERSERLLHELLPGYAE
ncbi:receptor-type guanylate cyclase gcy-28-like [Paramacrobiotus metropolitanus]|uniref:receptor-type guanylate cyclase gcy-28-like n=1 Tax=Paramacrobiotus metropolitanus TaxID=2943436 RepID=UPI0024458579|nr:receptor-type guanylate cyclase gcy-28-like [Paramacrobiotus metropolitanus]